MRVDSQAISQILHAMGLLGVNQSQLADRMGKSRSWVSRLLSGEITTLRPDVVDELNDALELDFRGPRLAESPATYGEDPLMMRLRLACQDNPDLTQALEAIARLTTPSIDPFLPHVSQKTLIKIGAELTRIVHRWEENQDPHYAKIAAEALAYLRSHFQSAMEPRNQSTK